MSIGAVGSGSNAAAELQKALAAAAQKASQAAGDVDHDGDSH